MTLEVRGLVAGYSDRPVLKGVSVAVSPGEFVLVAGPNGCGKTTLLRAIAGSLPIEAGHIEVGGQNVVEMTSTDRARKIAVIAQAASLPERFTAYHCVLMGRTPHLGFFESEGPRDAAVVAEAMNLAGCWDLRDRMVEELSGGECQRVLIARALAQEPDVLLLDEPTSHLDLKHQVETCSLVLRLCREQALAALGVVHDLTLAGTFGDRIVLVSDGRIVADGPAARVLREELLGAVYGTSVRVLAHPMTGRPIVVPEFVRLTKPDVDWLARVADPGAWNKDHKAATSERSEVVR